jgi:MoxR-like ATPase
MFETEGLNALYKKHRGTIDKVNEINAALNARFYKMDDAVECLMIAAMSGEAMVMMGPPGTAKSRLMRSFCNLIGLITDNALQGNGKEEKTNDAYFEYLLTQFTEPSELFGFYDLAKLNTNQGLVRKQENMMQMAQVVFLDEVFNASSAILNSLLTFMNERKFHDRGEVIPTPLRLLVSATNHPPQDATLGAIYDRFLLRCRVSNVASEAVNQEDIVGLLQAGWQETHAAKLDHKTSWTGLLDELKFLQDDIDARTASGALKIDPTHPMFADLTALVSKMVKSDLSEMSNRRLVKLADLVLSMRLLRSARAGEDKIEMQVRDLDVIARFSSDRDDPSAQARILQDLTEPRLSSS